MYDYMGKNKNFDSWWCLMRRLSPWFLQEVEIRKVRGGGIHRFVLLRTNGDAPDYPGGTWTGCRSIDDTSRALRSIMQSARKRLTRQTAPTGTTLGEKICSSHLRGERGGGGEGKVVLNQQVGCICSSGHLRLQEHRGP